MNAAVNASVMDENLNGTQLTYMTEFEESDDGLNDLSDLLSPLNADVIERELTELASSANGAFHDITVSELVSAIDGPLTGFSPSKSSGGSPPKMAFLRSANLNLNESPLSLFHPSILKRRQTMVDYQTPPSMKKSKINFAFSENQFSNSWTPFVAQTQSHGSNDLKCLPFSPTQV